MVLRTAADPETTSCPPTVAVPAVGRNSVVSILTTVDLPAPFGPRKPNTSPGATERSIPSTAITSPKVRTSPSASTAGLTAMGS